MPARRSTSNRSPSSITPQVTRLDNGLVVASVALPHVSRAHVAISLKGGPVHEDDATWGLSHVVEHMVFRGTKRHTSPRAVALAADAFGGDLDGATYRDRVIYDTRADPGALDDATALLADIVFRPRFTGIDTEKQVIREELLEALDDDGQDIDADNIAFRELFGGRPLARSIDGTLDTLDSFGRSEIRAFHRHAYAAGHAVLVGAGRVEHRALVASAKRHLGALPGGEGPLTGRAPPARRRRRPLKVVRTDASQTTVRLLFATPGARSPARHALARLARLLDDGPASILPSRLVDGEGLAYELWAALDLYAEEGALEIGAQVAHDRVGLLVERVVAELKKLRAQRVHDDDLVRTTARVRRELGDLRDHPGHLVDGVARALVLGLPFELARDQRAFDAVDGKGVVDVARRFVRADNASLVLVGLPPRADVKRAERALEALA